MPTSLEAIKSTISELPITERAELAQFILNTLGDAGDVAAHDWLEIARQRLHDLHTGKEAGIPAEVVLESMRRPRV